MKRVTILYLNVKATELYAVTAGNPHQGCYTTSSIFLQSLPAHAVSHLQCSQFDLIQLIVSVGINQRHFKILGCDTLSADKKYYKLGSAGSPEYKPNPNPNPNLIMNL